MVHETRKDDEQKGIHSMIIQDDTAEVETFLEETQNYNKADDSMQGDSSYDQGSQNQEEDSQGEDSDNAEYRSYMIQTIVEE